MLSAGRGVAGRGGAARGGSVLAGVRNLPGVALPNRLYWPSRPDGFDMRELVDVNYGKFRIFTFAGAKASAPRRAGPRVA